MALPGLASLFGRLVKRAVPFIQKAVALREGVRAIRRSLGASIAGVDREQLERVIRAERAAQETTERIVGRPPSERVDPDMLPQSITAQRRRFAWRVRYNFVDPNTNEIIQRYLTVSTDSVLSAEEAIQEAQEVLGQNYNLRQDQTFDLAVVRVTRAGELGTL